MEKNSTYFGVKEIARRANVSIATVDRVIHNRTGVSEKTKKKINEIIKELDYQPNILASRLASKNIIILAVLIPRVSEETDFWEVPLRGIQRADAEIKQYGIQTIPYFFDLSDKDSFVTQARLILERGVHGVMLSPSFIEQARNFTEECQKLKIPYVFIDSNIPEQRSLSYIGPHLLKSGYVGAKLLTYRMKSNKKVLVVNISKEIENYNYLQIEEGFRSYFNDNQMGNEIVRIDIKETDYLSVAKHMTSVLHDHTDIEAIFVTNSRVFTVATFLKNKNKNNISLIGYDFIKENIQYLNEGIIDFLICHKPEEQAYRAVMALYQTLVMGGSVDNIQYMPIDIITKENYEFYQN
ncbi:transcriptional regulator, LacI family [Dyadobacter koreensis]|uniref:Transcriptional regulator, LacI family n=1 Tax=Dyadobacter koreensis TaxID=408657 RepID=A0A1H7AH16_9BACT|nr:substrate-binding domain-containing protein [Dyadobacter koreensis]SEJ64933.1 transcriptional regulator, LacI family [Dyadobacter koreensis]